MEWPNFTNFLYMLPVAVDQSSYDGVAICYVFPVLWISTFYTMGQWSMTLFRQL